MDGRDLPRVTALRRAVPWLVVAAAIGAVIVIAHLLTT